MSAPTFADAVEVFGQAAYDVALDGLFVMPMAKREYKDARADLLAAYDADVRAAEARGRAAALAEVDAACAYLFADPKGPGWNLELIGPWPDDPPGTPWRLRTCPIDDYTAAPTPTAAILAAAAAVLDETAR